MIAARVTRTRSVGPSRPDRRRRRSSAAPRDEAEARAAAPAPDARVNLESLACRWQRSLDATESALSSARVSLEGPELGRRRRALAEERQETAVALARLARVMGALPAPWLSRVPVTPAMLGLPDGVEA